ncbi:hypothetical protein Pint_26492 [Pistacia integerrima]|uniref:Uncharacterized protein n=1 Tax=Pistacia integerrima TaxID=434235 RepID=A0ACC0YGY3_9ROSI|nr:hypothetical protein Pint_26492 [Pistacia integerrima]
MINIKLVLDHQTLHYKLITSPEFNQQTLQTINTANSIRSSLQNSSLNFHQSLITSPECNQQTLQTLSKLLQSDAFTTV